MVTCICEICGSSFSVRPSYAKARKCCSKECGNVWHSKVITEKNVILYAENKKICEICGKEFYAKVSRSKKGFGKFCSRKCAGIWHSKITSGENSYAWKGGLINHICNICNKEFLVKPSHIKRNPNKTCSKECSRIYRSKTFVKENSPAWKGGSSFYPYPVEWRKEFKEKIRNRDGNICFLCGKKDINKRLSVHHIDYDKENLSPENLISLCNKCHTKTNHNREHWIEVFHLAFKTLGVSFEIQ